MWPSRIISSNTFVFHTFSLSPSLLLAVRQYHLGQSVNETTPSSSDVVQSGSNKLEGEKLLLTRVWQIEMIKLYGVSLNATHSIVNDFIVCILSVCVCWRAVCLQNQQIPPFSAYLAFWYRNRECSVCIAHYLFRSWVECRATARPNRFCGNEMIFLFFFFLMRACDCSASLPCPRDSNHSRRFRNQHVCVRAFPPANRIERTAEPKWNIRMWLCSACNNARSIRIQFCGKWLHESTHFIHNTIGGTTTIKINQ